VAVLVIMVAHFSGHDSFIISFPDREFEKKEESIVTMAFLGDIMMDRGVRSSVYNNAGGDYGFLFEELNQLSQYDILFGNLEGPVSDKGNNVGSIYSFRMEPKSLDALVDAGFNVLSVANNHAGDWNVAAFTDTLDRLGNYNILAVGGGYNYSDASSVRVIEINGVSFGFLGFSDAGHDWLSASEESPGILIASDNNRNEIIKTASEEVDVLITSFHFGEEYELIQNERQTQLAQDAIDNGALIVVGHHPHVIQPVEEYNGGLIAYSLGNFIFDQYFSEDTMTGLLLDVSIQDNQIVEFKELITKQDDRFKPNFKEDY